MEDPINILHPSIALTNNVELTNGAHILYTYNDKNMYIENLVSFLATGLKEGHGVILIDNQSTLTLVFEKLLQRGFLKEQLESIIFSDSEAFYRSNELFNIKSIVRTFARLIDPFVKKGIPLRTWAKVKWLEDQCCINDKLRQFEDEADLFVREVASFSICAYDGNKLPSNILLDLLKNHQHMMTDTELHTSPLFSVDKTNPSLIVEEKLEEKISIMNEDLQNIHSTYRNIMDQMPDAVFITTNHLDVIYANHAATNLLQCNMEQLLKLNILDFIEHSFHEEMINRFNQLQRGYNLLSTEQRIITRDGTIIDVEVVNFPFTFDLQKPTIISIVRNIKERIENQKLTLKTEKLSIAGQLAASIAHEIRNPLTSIKGFINLAQQGSLNSHYYTIINDELDRIESIASELLILGKPISLEFEKYDLSIILNDICTFLYSEALMHNVVFDLEEVHTGCFIKCNQGQMKQVFINILKNSIDAMENGGTIFTKAFVEQNHVIIEIVDEGKGIPESIKDKLGEPFYSTKIDGTGLGLMVCFNIIEQHGGQMVITSEEEVGTKVQILLPKAN